MLMDDTIFGVKHQTIGKANGNWSIVQFVQEMMPSTFSSKPLRHLWVQFR